MRNQELWIGKIFLLRTNCTTSLKTKCPPRALHRNTSSSLPNKMTASGSRNTGLVNKMYWTSANWSLVFNFRRRKGWRISFRAACKKLHKIWRAQSEYYAFPFLSLENNLHSNRIVSLTLWKVKRYYYTSDSLWKIWFVESIQSIHNSLWTWHDKCNLSCQVQHLPGY